MIDQSKKPLHSRRALKMRTTVATISTLLWSSSDFAKSMYVRRVPGHVATPIKRAKQEGPI